MAEPTPNDLDARYTHWRWRIFFITWLAYVGFYLTRKSFAVAKVDLARPEVMGLSLGAMSWVDMVYAAAYAGGQFVWGMCGDRFGTRRVVLCGMMASVLTGAVMGVSSWVVLMGALFCFQGVCQSTGWAPLSKNICNFFSQGERGRIMGFWATNYAIGGVIASALAAYSIEWAGQNRLEEFQSEGMPTVRHVQRVAASHGLDDNVTQDIYGHLRIAHVATNALAPIKTALEKFEEKKLSAADRDKVITNELDMARARLRGLLQNEKELSPRVRAGALRGLFELRAPRLDEALMAALQSKDAALSGAGQRVIKKAVKSEVPELRQSGLKALRAAVLSKDEAPRQLGLKVALTLPPSGKREFAIYIAGQSTDPAIEQLAANLKSEIENHNKEKKKKLEAPPEFNHVKTLEAIHNNSIQTIWGMLAWRYAFWVPAGLLLCIWGLFVWLQRNRPQDVGLPPIEDYKGESRAVLTGDSKESEAAEGTWRLIWQVMRNRMVLLLAGVYFFMKPTRYFILFWSPLYVYQKLGTSAGESGVLGSLFELAGPLGVLAGGYLSDKVFATRRMPAAIISLFVVAAVLFVFNGLPATAWSMGLGFLFIGFFLFMPDSLVSATAAIDFGTRQGASTASGMINGFGSIGQMIGVALPGILEGWLGEGADIWPYVFPILGGTLIIAAVLLLPQWNTLPATAEDKGEKSA